MKKRHYSAIQLFKNKLLTGERLSFQEKMVETKKETEGK